jgi:D-lactate dehydrogenase
MKFCAYNVSSDERSYFDAIGAELGVEYVLVSKPLDSENAVMAEGCDGVLDFLPDREYSERILATFSDFGIKYLSLRTAGFDMVDPKMFGKYDIKVANVPAYSPSAIAEFAVLLSLMLLRKMQIYLPRVKTQDFSRAGMVGGELNAKTVGIIGTGRIGFETAKIFKGFGARVIGFDKFRNDKAGKILEYVDDLNDLLTQSDIISLHIPLLPDNRHLIDEGSISKMKDGVILINTARGGHMNFKDVLRNLLSKKVGGLGIDVFEFRKVDRFGKSDETEIIDDRTFLALNSLPNVIITPHTAYNTDIATHNMVKISTENLLEFLKKGDSKNRVV